MIRLERKKSRVRGKAITPPQPKANQVVNRKIDTGNLNCLQSITTVLTNRYIASVLVSVQNWDRNYE